MRSQARTHHIMKNILSVNIGSSSIKFAVYSSEDGISVEKARASGTIEGLEPGGVPKLAWNVDGKTQADSLALPPGQPTIQAAFDAIRPLIESVIGPNALSAVAHRIVHGGTTFIEPIRICEGVLEKLENLNDLAPLHQPHNIAGARACLAAFPGIPQLACFDTAFHHTISPLEQHYAIPERFFNEGIRRYGFHGLSYEYVASRLAQKTALANKRMIMAHLGNGASLCATVDGKSVGTSMGFSALDGLMMGSRSGSIDPGVLLHLMRQGWPEKQISDLLYKQSGLLGVSGESADMRTLQRSGSDTAQLAIALFCHRVQKELAALTSLTKGLDVVAFTGGIGEHDHAVRARICEGLQYMGIHIDPRLNEQADGTEILAIHTPHSYAEIWVVPTDEGRIAAEAACKLLMNQSAGNA